MPRALVIGIGNPDRGDDGAGRAVARLLTTRALPKTDFRETEGEATDILAFIEEAEAVWLVDASRSGAAPGAIRTFDLNEGPLPATAGDTSTHGLGLSQALELARAFGTLPSHCRVLAIEGKDFETGAPMSPHVRTAVEELTARLETEIREAVTAQHRSV